MKKFLSVVLAMAIIICAVPMGVFSFDVHAYEAEGFTYIVNNDEVEIISPSDYPYGDLVIPSSLGGYPVTRIGDSAFNNCRSITSITIPDSVITIGDCAFEMCTFVEKITIPDSVTAIGDNAFRKCHSLCEVKLGSGITTIGEEAFAECLIEDLTIPDSVKIVGERAFSMCHQLKNIYDGSGVSDISIACFHYCARLKRVVLADGVENIGSSAFSSCIELENITIPNSVTSIGEGAFDSCENIENVYYASGESDKNNIDISIRNTYLLNARWHYNRLYPDASSNDWYSDAVKYVSKNGIMSGYSNGLFGTSDSIQRQDFLVMLARLDGVDLNVYGAKKSAFPDVPEGSYFEAAVNWGSEKGIVTGYQNGKFGVGDKVTREQLVTFLYRYAKYKGYDYSYTTDRETVVSGQYIDYKNVSGFAKDSILWAIEKGVISGKTSSTIVPQGNAQRCEVAKIMYNIYVNDIFK